MKIETNRIAAGPLMPIGLLVLFFVLSLGLFFLFRPSVDGRVFFYPDNSGSRIEAERRSVPRQKDPAGRIHVFLEELFLGPVTLKYSPAAPFDTEVRHVAVIEKTVYVDLGKSMLKCDEQLAIGFDEALENLQYNILRNFPRMEKVVFTIEGSEVHAPYFGADLGSE